VRNCPQCSAELSSFRDVVGTFKAAMRNWSELETVPPLERRANGPFSWKPSLCWALAGMAVVAVMVLPGYPGGELERKANEDALLMDEVAAHLSRPLPMSMERVMLLLPGNESEEVR
jgi:hypothetical protein